MEPTSKRVGNARRLGYPTPSELSLQRLDELCTRITNSILKSLSTSDASQLGPIVAAALAAFVESQADVEQASATVAHLMERVGARQARRDTGPAELATAFRIALVATQKGLVPVVGDLINRDALLQLREDLVAYLAELHLLAHASLVRTRRQLSLPADAQERQMQALAFGAHKNSQSLAASMFGGVDPAAHVVVIVSIATDIPQALLNHPDTVRGRSSKEVLLPAAWDFDRIADQLGGQAIFGPVAPVARALEALELARQAADLLREGIHEDSRTVVPCADMLGDLIAYANPMLAELMIDKHLRPLSALPLPRRVDLSELLLHTLEYGKSSAAAARDLDLSRQTAFSRMRSVNELLGDVLDDPGQRLEITVALRAALPQWKLQLGCSTQPPAP